ncbi:MAG: acyl-CoA dehydrogenase [Planctomycetota bacterium]|nr:MAG: acyl-CoA dehydrogenase [Planctomycetota bacterium]
MDFLLSEEHEMIRDMARDFAEREVEPLAEKIDKEHYYPKELVAKMAELGLMGVAVPEEWGGAGMDNLAYVIAMEEISAKCASTGVIMSVNNSLVCDPLLTFGTDGQKEEWLKPLASGEKLGCMALTEPSAGTDAGAVKTTAVRDGDDYVLNGAKLFITNGREADSIIVFATVDKEKKHRGITAFVHSKDTPGYSVGKIEEKLGIHGSSTAELVYEDCRIPASQLLGEEEKGFKVAMATLDGGRIGIAAQALGIGRAALDCACAYAKERQQFGKPLAAFQAIQWMIADMACELDAARLLVHRAAWQKDQKSGRYSMASAMAKLKAAEVASFCANKALQIHGGYGYSTEYLPERLLRDAKITEIYEGTSEVQRMVISGMLLKD